MRRKVIIVGICIFTSLFLVGGISVYLLSQNDSSTKSTQIPSSYSDKKDALSYAVSYPFLNNSNDLIALDATKGWSDFQIYGFKIKYPNDELEVELPISSEVKFKNLKNKDFTYGLKLYTYDTSAHSSSMNLLENFVVNVHGTIPHDIHQVQKFKNFEIAQIGNYFNVDGDGFYDLISAVKIGDKGIVFETAFISEEEFNKAKDLLNTTNDFIYRLIITSLEDTDSKIIPDTKLNKPSAEVVERYRQANFDKNITL